MSRRSRAALIAITLAFAATAAADGINNPTTQFVGNMGGEGPNNATTGGAPPPPTECGTGVIDTTTGCALPMFGGL